MFEISEVTKETILNKLSQEEIMVHYLGVPITKKLFKSPLRVDHKVTCTFYKKNGLLKFHDFATGDDFDIFAVVQQVFNCGFAKAKSIIANDFGLRKSKTEVHQAKLVYNGEVITEDEPSYIQVEIKEYTEKELQWWNSFGVSLEILKKFNVFSIKTVFINSIPCYFSSDNSPIYGYYFGIIEGIERWKIYFPRKTERRFLLNTNVIQGINMLPKTGDILVITKALKDVMTLYSLGITAVAPQSENSYIKDKDLDKLRKRFKNIVIFWDSDLPGIRSMNKYRKANPDLFPIWIPRSLKAKDISDYYKKHGKNKTIKLIETFKEYYEKQITKKLVC